jgi:phosphoenolpyruvate-protein phosphotransferase (PTS system enzyme I)
MGGITDSMAVEAGMSVDATLLTGVPISPGVAHGVAYVLEGIAGVPAPLKYISEAEVEGELARFETAIERAVRELLELRDAVAQHIGASEAEIFAAHALLVRSPSLVRKVSELVREKHLNAEAALGQVIQGFIRAFDEIRNDSMRQRRTDIQDIGRRILSALLDQQGGFGASVPEGAILVTDELTPSITASVQLRKVAAIVTERGGRFGHSAILARSGGTPAVSCIDDATLRIRTGDPLIVDAMSGTVLVNPTPEVQAEYETFEAEMRAFHEELLQLVDQPAVTLDGAPIELLANVGVLSEAQEAAALRSPGIGLLRTELLYAARTAFPSEDEELDQLAGIVEVMHPHPVVLRLLDLGADKQLAYWPLPASSNPAVAPRGIRVLLAHPDVLERQLRVFLRLGARFDVRILVPGVAGVEEIRKTRDAIVRVRAELAAAGVPHNPDVQLGAMIELPSAALLVDRIAREVDFLSLGTNDLVQYVLAADRDGEGSAPYYRPLHPAVLALIARVAAAAGAAGKPLNVCGEFAGDAQHAEVLLGLGVRALSVAPQSLLSVRQGIRSIRVDHAEALAGTALSLGSLAEIEDLIAERGVPLLPPSLSRLASRNRNAGRQVA